MMAPFLQQKRRGLRYLSMRSFDPVLRVTAVQHILIQKVSYSFLIVLRYLIFAIYLSSSGNGVCKCGLGVVGTLSSSIHFPTTNKMAERIKACMHLIKCFDLIGQLRNTQINTHKCAGFDAGAYSGLPAQILENVPQKKHQIER